MQFQRPVRGKNPAEIPRFSQLCANAHNRKENIYNLFRKVPLTICGICEKIDSVVTNPCNCMVLLSKVL
jgi:hypothetical protein